MTWRLLAIWWWVVSVTACATPSGSSRSADATAEPKPLTPEARARNDALSEEERLLATCRTADWGRRHPPGHCYGDALITLLARHGDVLAARRLEALDVYLAAEPSISADTAALHRLLWQALPAGRRVMRRLQDHQATAAAKLYAMQASAARAHGGATGLPMPTALRGGSPMWMEEYAEEENALLGVLETEQNQTIFDTTRELRGKAPTPRELSVASERYRRFMQQKPTLAKLLHDLPAASAYLQLVEYRAVERVTAPTSRRARSDLGMRPRGEARYFGFAAREEQGALRLITADLGPVAHLDEQVDQLRRAIADVAPVSAMLQQLYRAVLGPFDPILRGAKQIVIAPAATLNLLPFEALRLDDGTYVGDRSVVAYGKARDLLFEELLSSPSLPSPEPGVVLADPAYDGAPPTSEAPCGVGEQRGLLLVGKAFPPQFPGLPCTGQEADAVAGLARRPLEVLRGLDATETALRRRERPELLHLATHGFVLPPPSVGGLTYEQLANAPYEVSLLAEPLSAAALAFAGANGRSEAMAGLADNDDGLLSAAEVRRLNLNGTRLVVMSACQSAQGLPGAGGSLLGLRHAFRSAGAQAVVGSLWSVSDITTSWFMALFYARYFAGDPPAVALRFARIELRKKCVECAHPFFWAPFVVEGGKQALSPLARGHATTRGDLR